MSLLILSGLPGSGKTTFAYRFLELTGPHWLYLSSDKIRRQFNPQPSYSRYESARVFREMRQRMADALLRGIPVIYDATNCNAQHLDPIVDIWRECRQSGEIALVRLDYPPAEVKARLEARAELSLPERGYSDGDWKIYQRMRNSWRYDFAYEFLTFVITSDQSFESTLTLAHEYLTML